MILLLCSILFVEVLMFVSLHRLNARFKPLRNLDGMK